LAIILEQVKKVQCDKNYFHTWRCLSLFRLLIVDDEPFIAEGISRIVDWAEYGIEICLATSSSLEALDYILKNHVDILLTDIKMPDLNGIDLIRTIKQREIDVCIIVLSGYNEFEYVRTAALMGIENYLLKPVNIAELDKTLLNTIRNIENKKLNLKNKHENYMILRNNILNIWVNGNMESGIIKEKLSLIGINSTADCYQAIIIRLLPREVGDNDISISCMKEAEIYLAEFTAWQNSYVSFYNGNNELVLIHMNSENNGNLPTPEFADNLAHSLRKAINTDVFICIGNTVYEPALLHHSYHFAHDIASCASYIGFNTLTCNVNNILSYNNNELTAEQCRNLRMFALMQDFDAVSLYFSNAIKNTYAVKPILKTVLLTAVYSVFSEFEDYLVPTRGEILSSRKSLPLADNISSSSDCMEVFKQTISLISSYILTNKRETNTNYVTRMKRIAQNRSSEIISLKIISDEFGMSPIYLGSLFIHETGETFSSYINRIKIDKAKLLLKDKSLKIADVSRLTGFSTINYFYAIFKKQTGLSPAEYREKL
jgi:Response regulator containing CheY-like receiver domain and AraC-type DNA-binding domain